MDTGDNDSVLRNWPTVKGVAIVYGQITMLQLIKLRSAEVDICASR